MQLNDTHKMAIAMDDRIRDYFEDKVGQFVILDANDDVNHRMFSIQFVAYNYFNIILNYERGRFGCSIRNGEYYISLDNSQKWYIEYYYILSME